MKKMSSFVSLVKSPDHHTGVRAALFPFQEELKKRLSKIENLVIKINFVSTTPELATTPFEAVKAFVDFLPPFYGGQIIIAEEASLGNTLAGFEKYGFHELAKENPQVRLLDLAEDETIERTIPYPGGEVNLPCYFRCNDA